MPEQLLSHYLETFTPVQLRWNKKRTVDERYPVFTFGTSKGLTFERVLIYPTKPMLQWFQDDSAALTNDTRAKLYVGLTRPVKVLRLFIMVARLSTQTGLKFSLLCDIFYGLTVIFFTLLS
ncbi:hypothetical protein ACFFW8_11200 [Erwinia tracheiphila]